MTKYMLVSTYDAGTSDTVFPEWDPADAAAHMDYLRVINREIAESGELVETTALTWPEQAKVVRSDGIGAPVLTDGPFAEVKEMLAGYVMVDVESEERALEIAARLSAAPGPGGVPLQQPIQVRQVMGAPVEDL